MQPISLGGRDLFRRTVSALMFTMLLAGMLTLAFNTRPVKASGTIYIRADGSIDPPIATISSVDNVTYTFTDSINDSIVVERDSIVVDGAGYTVSGVNPVSGVDLSERVNVTVKGATIRDFNAAIGVYLKNASLCSVYGNNVTDNFVGIVFDHSSNCTISGNNITDSHNLGIGLEFSSNCTISGNNIRDNEYGILIESSSGNSVSGNKVTNNSFYGISIVQSPWNTLRGNVMAGNGRSFTVYSAVFPDFVQDVDVSNTVDGKPIYYWINVHDATVPLDAGYVALVNSTSITVQNLNLTKKGPGILLAYTTNSTITKNEITDNSICGIQLYGSPDNTVSGNNITNDGDGIWLEFSSNCTISGNNMTNNLYGIWLGSSSNCTISGNNITANHYYGNGGGISVMYSNYSTISGNNIKNNDYGIVMDSSSNNKICHNNFVNNTAQTFFTLSINAWDDGYPSGGNYWDDYSGEDSFKGLYQNETGSDGIGDSPYIIYESIIDKYPLVAPWTSLVGDINQDRTVDIYDAILLSNAYNSSPSSPNWNINADINGDNTVDIYDAIILASNFGKTG
jgi:parallel beta-helix repeat protein